MTNGSTIFRTIFQASQIAPGYGVCVHRVYGHLAIFCMVTWRQARQSRMEAVRKTYGNRSVPRRSCRAVSVDSARKSHGARARRWCGDFARAV